MVSPTAWGRWISAVRRSQCILLMLGWAAAVGLPGGTTRAQQPDVAYGPVEELGQMEKETIKESSGLTSSSRHDDLFWTHNDSGGEPRLYAFNRQGQHAGTSKIKRAEHDDWEALDSYQLNGRPYLLIGDIGDNAFRRDHATIYVVPEPVAPSDEGQAVAQLDFRFEGGPVDCEAMAIDSDRGQLFLVEKQMRRLTSRVFVLDWPEELPIGVKKSDRPILQAKLLGEIPQIAVTDMDISADNQRLVLNTYGDIYVYTRTKTETWSDGLQRRPLRIRAPARRQGEAVCFDHASHDIWLTSEGTSAPIWRLRPLQTTEK